MCELKLVESRPGFVEVDNVVTVINGASDIVDAKFLKLEVSTVISHLEYVETSDAELEGTLYDPETNELTEYGCRYISGILPVSELGRFLAEKCVELWPSTIG